MNQQQTVSNIETLKAIMMLTVAGKLDHKTIRHALMAFTLMEHQLIHFEDNYRQVFLQAQRQLARDNAADQANSGTNGKSLSPMKIGESNGTAKKTAVLGASPNKQKNEVDMICVCRPREKERATWKVKSEHEVHANPECPFRRLNAVQKWQMRAPSQRGCQNLPLDEEVLYMTMALLDYTMSPDLIKGWFKKVRPFLKCEDKQRQEFDQTVRQV